MFIFSSTCYTVGCMKSTHLLYYDSYYGSIRARESGGYMARKKGAVLWPPLVFRCKIISELSLGLIIILQFSAIRPRCHCCGEQHQCSRSNSNNKDEAEQCIHFCLLLFIPWMIEGDFLIHTAILSSQCKISKNKKSRRDCPCSNKNDFNDHDFCS